MARLDGWRRSSGQRGGCDQENFAGTEEGIVEGALKIRARALNAGSDAHAAVSAFAVGQKSQKERQPEPLALPQPRTQSSKLLICHTLTTEGYSK